MPSSGQEGEFKGHAGFVDAAQLYSPTVSTGGGDENPKTVNMAEYIERQFEGVARSASTAPFDQPGDDPRGLSLEALRHQTHVG